MSHINPLQQILCETFLGRLIETDREPSSRFRFEMRATLYSTRRRLTTVCESHGRPASPRTQSGHPSRRRGALRIRAMFGSPDFSETAPVPDAIPATAVDSDWRSFRAKLVARYPEQHNALEWAHPLPSPELGCILVAHPLMFAQQQTYFNLAVIFVFVHDHFGTAGLILNKPTRYSLGDLDLMKNAANGFEDNTLYMGGDVGDDALNLLHPFKDIKDSVPVIDGVYLNGFEEAQKSILKGKRRPSDFKWYARYCGWHPGQVISFFKAFSLPFWFSWRKSAKVVFGFLQLVVLI